MTYVHYVEQMVGVPHRYFKYYKGKIIVNKKNLNLPIIGFVRYLNKNIINDIEGNNRKFSNKKILNKVIHNGKKLYSTKTRTIFDFLKVKLQKDCFYLLKEKPNL